MGTRTGGRRSSTGNKGGGSPLGSGGLAAAVNPKISPMGVSHTNYSGDEITAIKDYQISTYKEINDQLRAGVIESHTQEKINDLDSAMAKGTLTRDVTVYRGTQMGARLSGLAVGGELHDKAFISTTSQKSIAFRGDTLFTIRAPKGSKGIDVEHSGISIEKELLLNRGSRFRITSMRKNYKGVNLIGLELLP